MVADLIGPMGKPTYLILQNGNSIKLFFKFISLYFLDYQSFHTSLWKFLCVVDIE